MNKQMIENNQVAKNFFEQGNQLRHENKWKEAIVAYNRALEINPNYFWSCHCLAIALFRQGNFDEAIAASRKAIQLNIDLGGNNKDKAKLYNQLGRSFDKKGNLEEAIKYYKLAVENDPYFAPVYQNLAQIIKSPSQKSLLVYLKLGDILRKNNQVNEAIAAYQKSLELKPDSHKSYLNLAQLYSQKGELNNAIDSYQKAINLKPDLSFNFYNNLGNLLKLQARPLEEAKTKTYKVVVCATFKNEAPYILEWIAHHRVIKVDHFLIYNNDSTDNTKEILQALDRADIITYIDWPSRPNINNQIAVYKDAYLKLVGKCEWIAFIDGDEFIVPNKHQDLPSCLSDYEDVAGIFINWKTFGSSGHTTKTDGLVMERFKRCARGSAPVNSHGKTIAKTDFIEGLNVHNCKFSEESLYIYPDRTPVPELSRNLRGKGTHITHNVLQINHYVTKSKAEWELKRARGRATIKLNSSEKIRSENYFKIHDQNNAEDLKILRFLEKTKQEIKFLIEVAGLNQVAKKFFEQGNQLRQESKWEEAIIAYNRSLEINPNFFWSYHCLAISLFRQGKFDEAIAASRRAIQLNIDLSGNNKDQAKLYNQLGRSLDKKGNLKEAIKYYELAVKNDLNFTPACRNLAQIVKSSTLLPTTK